MQNILSRIRKIITYVFFYAYSGCIIGEYLKKDLVLDVWFNSFIVRIIVVSLLVVATYKGVDDFSFR